MEFLEKNARGLGLITVLLLVIGFAIAFFSTRSQKNEIGLQEKMANLELEYSKYKEDFSKSQIPVLENPKNEKEIEAKKKKEVELAKLKETVTQSRQKLIADFQKFITENPKSISTSMATLYLSDLYLDNNQQKEALNLLKSSTYNNNDLTSILVQKKLGSLLADNDQCDDAIKAWDQLLSNKKAQFAHSEIKILESLCYQKSNNLKKAEELLTSVKNDKDEGATEYSQRAEKILRLIQFKKMTGT